jgi:hypothetical protein
MQMQQQLRFPPRLVLSKDTLILLNFQSTQERKKERKKEIRRSKKKFTKLQALHTKKKKKKKLECGCVLQGLAVMKKAMY